MISIDNIWGLSGCIAARTIIDEIDKQAIEKATAKYKMDVLGMWDFNDNQPLGVTYDKVGNMHINTIKQEDDVIDDPYADAFRYFLETHSILDKYKFKFPYYGKTTKQENEMEDLDKYVGKEVSIELNRCGIREMTKGVIEKDLLTQKMVVLHNNSYYVGFPCTRNKNYAYGWGLYPDQYTPGSIKLVNLKDEINARIDAMAEKFQEKLTTAETNEEKIKAYELAIKYCQAIHNAGVKFESATLEDLHQAIKTADILYIPSIDHCKEQIKKLKETYIAKLEVRNDDLWIMINGRGIVSLDKAGDINNWTTNLGIGCLEVYNKWLTTGMKIDKTPIVFNGRYYSIVHNKNIECGGCCFLALDTMQGIKTDLPHIKKYANNMPIIY